MTCPPPIKSTTSLPAVGDVARAIEAWAEPAFATSYDNVGLHVGDPARLVHRGLVALDLVPEVVCQAVAEQVSLVITHHPLFFHPARNITTRSLIGSMALELAEARIALYSAHTNLDAAPGGVSFALATLLGAQTPRFLQPNVSHTAGMGAIGTLRAPVPLSSFLETVAIGLQTPSIRYTGALDTPIKRVAVCGGAGSGLIQDALRAKADVLVTADVSYHRFFEVLRPDGSAAMALVDAGHYETERHAEVLLCAALRQRFPQVPWNRARAPTSPVNTYVRRREP